MDAPQRGLNSLSRYAGDAQAELDVLMASVTATHRHFDKLELIVDERPPEKLFSKLGEDAHSVHWLPDLLRDYARVAARDDCPPNLLCYRDFPWWLPVHRKLIVVAAHEDALGRIAKQPWKLGNVELACDRVFSSTLDALDMLDFNTRHGVQPWHRTRRMNSVGATRDMSERRRPGVNLIAYADGHCKFSGEGPCYHFEGRVVGKRARQSLGLHSTADLPRFGDTQFDAFFRRYERYAVIDRERLGRFLDNLRTGERRQNANIEDYGGRYGHGLSFNFDRRGGGLAWRSFASHPKLELYATQAFIEAFGPGPWLIPLFIHRYGVQ